MTIVTTLENVLVGFTAVLLVGNLTGFAIRGKWDGWWARRKLNELRRRHRRLVNRVLKYNIRSQDEISR